MIRSEFTANRGMGEAAPDLRMANRHEALRQQGIQNLRTLQAKQSSRKGGLRGLSTALVTVVTLGLISA